MSASEQSMIGTLRPTDVFSHVWLIQKLNDAAKYPEQHGIKFNGLTALNGTAVMLSVDGQIVDLPEHIKLDGIEFIRVGHSNPWTSKKPGTNGIQLTSSETETLIALIENGPLWDGDVPCKSGRDSLVQKGLAEKIIVKGEDGYQAATYRGREYYTQLYGGKTLQEAIDQRRAAKQPNTTTTLLPESAFRIKD